jgi:Tfp pilus assembly protein PilX
MHNTFTHIPSRGYVLVLSIVFLCIFFTVATSYLSFVTTSARNATYSTENTQALALAEAGVDKAVYQLNQDGSYSGESDTTISPGAFTVTISTIDASTRQITATGFVPDSVNPRARKTIRTNVAINNSVVAFHYGVQAGAGGFSLYNSSSITGNVFSDGPIIGSSANHIYGDVVSSGEDGRVYGIHATSSVYAHTIGRDDKTTIIDKDAYYVTKIDTTVHGTSHPDSPDQASVPLPISDDQINQWEAVAEAGGIATCSGGSYAISSGNITLGPVKIPCNLQISNSANVTVNGHIWVTGNITIKNSAVVKISESLGDQNVAIIADNPSDTINSSIISVKNTATFQDSGTPGSFIFLISQNRSAENGGSIAAIDLGNSASALVAYAAHGLIPLANSVSLKEVTAYKITLANYTNVTYDTGLISANFSSGPGGAWAFVPGTYAISP